MSAPTLDAAATTPFEVDDFTRAKRFLILGAEGGTYSTVEKTLAVENASSVVRLLGAGRGEELVEELVSISVEGRAAKQGPTLFVLAMCCRLGDLATRRLAYSNLHRVCRIPTHLFTFVGFAEAMAEGTGWGRLQKRAVAAFYNGKKPMALANAVTKYRQREGWTHRDVLRLAHVKPGSPGTAAVLKYAAKGWSDGQAEKIADVAGDDADATAAVALLAAVEEAKTAELPRLLELVAAHRLAREHIPTEHLNELQVWEALMDPMPMTAMLRNLAKMTSVGLLKPLGAATTTVCERVVDEGRLKSARVHPFSVLLAKTQYALGKGSKGSLEWEPVPAINAALGRAFRAAFGSVVPTGKRIMQAVDCSGSMAWSKVQGSEQIDARTAAAALAHLTACTEPQCHTVAFGTTVEPLDLSAATSLAEACATVSALPEGPFDLVLVLDCTGSMGAWIKEAQDKLIAITEQLGAWFTRTPGALRVGFVAYRDIGDRGQLVVVQPTADYQSVLAVVEQQSASGGGDYPEDVAGGFHAVLTAVEWRADSTKLVVHIADAPPHGTQFGSGVGGSDNYPGGDPAGRSVEGQLAEMATRGIDYVFMDVAGGERLAAMKALFASSYNDAPGRTGQQMSVTALGSESSRLERAILDVVERSAYGGGTDCAAPIRYAREEKIPVDAFIVYTDSETETKGGCSAAEELRKYRAEMGIAAKLVCVALTASEHTIADPDDAGMLDMVGFDSAAPEVLRQFVLGAL